MSTINVSATRPDGLDISEAVRTIRYVAGKAGIELEPTEHRLRGHGPRVELEQIGTAMRLHGFDYTIHGLVYTIVDDVDQDPPAAWTATIDIDPTSCAADATPAERLRLAERLAQRDDRDEPGSGDAMHQWYVQCTLSFLRARLVRSAARGTHVRRIEVSGSRLDPKRALIAAMRPFGSLSAAYDVDPTAVADLMIAWVERHEVDTATALISAVRAATCTSMPGGTPDCCTVTLGTCTVSLHTPTSGTEIRLQRHALGRAVIVDFGEGGSSSRADEIVEGVPAAVIGAAWDVELVNGTRLTISGQRMADEVS